MSDDFAVLIKSERILVEISVAHLKEHYPGAEFESVVITKNFHHIIRASMPDARITFELDMGSFGLEEKG